MSMKDVPEVSQFYTHSQVSREGSAIPSSSMLSVWSRHIAFTSSRTYLWEAPPCFQSIPKTCLPCAELLETNYRVHDRDKHTQIMSSKTNGRSRRCQNKAMTYPLGMPAAAVGLFLVEAGAGWLTEYCLVLGTLVLQPHISRPGCLWSPSNWVIASRWIEAVPRGSSLLVAMPINNANTAWAPWSQLNTPVYSSPWKALLGWQGVGLVFYRGIWQKPVKLIMEPGSS